MCNVSTKTKTSQYVVQSFVENRKVERNDDIIKQMMVTLMQHTSIKQSISAQQMYEPTHTKKTKSKYAKYILAFLNRQNVDQKGVTRFTDTNYVPNPRRHLNAHLIR